MEDKEKDVQLESSTNEETTVTTETQPVDESVDTSAATTDTASNVESKEVDERGVDYKNVAMEYKRKLEQTTERLPQIIQEEIRRANEQNSKQKYTVQELEQFAQDNPQHRPWVEAEKFKLLKEELEQSQNQRLDSERKQMEASRNRKEAEDYVVSKYPEVFVKDNAGRVQGWNNNHPMTQLIADYMSVPDIKSRPDALKWAAKLAYADYLDMKAPTTEKKVKALKTEVKKIQQRTMTEGNTRPAAQSSDTRKSAIEQLSRTGSEKDGRAAVREILKLSGLIKE